MGRLSDRWQVLTLVIDDADGEDEQEAFTYYFHILCTGYFRCFVVTPSVCSEA